MSTEAPAEGTPASPAEAGMTDTGSGFIAGADPKQPPRTAAEWGEPETAVGQSQQPVQVVDQAPSPNGQMFTAEDIEKARREEKDKLYSRMETMQEQLARLEEERKAREEAEKRAKEEEAARIKAEEEAAMETRELLEKKEQEWQAQLDELRTTYEQDKAVFDKERRFMELEQYKQARIEQESEYIMPELRDMIGGSDEAAIDQSIEDMKQRTAIIMSNMTDAAQQQRQTQRGVAPTGAAPVGPMENVAENQSLTPEDIRTMDMETYRKYREQLVSAASAAYRRGG
jgi:hypothetical protein